MKRTHMMIAIFILLLTSLGIWYAWESFQKQHGLIASGTIEAIEISLGSKLGGEIEAIHIQEGDQVKENQPLVQFEKEELNQQLAQADAQVKAAQSRLKLLQAGTRLEDIESAEASVRVSEAQLQQLKKGSRKQEIERGIAEVTAKKSQMELAQKEMNRMQNLLKTGDVTQEAYDKAQNDLKTSQAALKAAEETLRLIQEGPRQEDVSIAQQQLRQSRAQLTKMRKGARYQELQEAREVVHQHEAYRDLLKTRINDTTIKSPCTCTVSVIDGEAGEIIARGTPVVTLIDTRSLWVKVYVSPVDLKHIQLNQHVRVQVDAYPGRDFIGTIINIASKAEFTPRNVQTREERINQVFGVKIAIDNREGKLFPGMPADAILDTQQEKKPSPASTK